MNLITGQKLKSISIICLCLFITIINCDESTEPKPNPNPKNPDSNSQIPQKSNTDVKKEDNSELTQSTLPPNNVPPSLNDGALMRGVSVFLGLSLIVIAYIIFRCTRLSKNRTQMVRKYGILANRQDVEMRPLPLDDEDEDDTTVFDVSEVAVHNKQRRST